jgi:hypothetical protein
MISVSEGIKNKTAPSMKKRPFLFKNPLNN